MTESVIEYWTISSGLSEFLGREEPHEFRLAYRSALQALAAAKHLLETIDDDKLVHAASSRAATEALREYRGRVPAGHRQHVECRVCDGSKSILVDNDAGRVTLRWLWQYRVLDRWTERRTIIGPNDLEYSRAVEREAVLQAWALVLDWAARPVADKLVLFCEPQTLTWAGE